MDGKEGRKDGWNLWLRRCPAGDEAGRVNLGGRGDLLKEGKEGIRVGWGGDVIVVMTWCGSDVVWW